MPPLGSPDLSAIAPVAVSPQPDRAPDSLASGTPEALRRDLVALLGQDRVLARPIDLIRYATDASPYRLFPKVVVVAQDALAAGHGVDLAVEPGEIGWRALLYLVGFQQLVLV
jgi:hypothetical protein